MKSAAHEGRRGRGRVMVLKRSMHAFLRWIGIAPRQGDPALLAQARQLEETCDVVRYTALPAVGGTAHVLEVVRGCAAHKSVGRTKAEAYRKMIEQLASADDDLGRQ